MAVKTDVREVKNKKNKEKMVTKKTYKCEGSYVDVNGVPHRYHKRGFESKDEAQYWERAFLLKAKNEADSKTTVKELFILFIDSRKGIVKERSLYDIKTVIEKHIVPYWGNVRISDLSINRIQKWQQYLIQAKQPNGKIYSNATLEKIQARFKTLLHYGYSNGYINNRIVVDFKTVVRSEEQKKEMQFWHPEEYEKFIDVVDEDVYIALFNVLYWCGLRLGELLALQWKDVNMKSKTIRINKSYTKHLRQTTSPKTHNSYRDVLIPEKCFQSVSTLYEAHKRYAGFDETRLLFNFEKPLDDNTIRIKKDKWIDKANVKRIRIHDFRHSHVSLLISLGFNPFDIAKRLGHTVNMVNEVYGHWFDSAQKKMVDALNKL